MHNNLLEKAKTLPNKAGCYLMKRIRAGEETVLYVGKAKSLRSRVSSYFNNSTKSPKTEILVSHINDFDFIMTDSDAEAFVLENNLIKKYEEQQNKVRNNREFDAITKEIEFQNLEIELAEKRIKEGEFKLAAKQEKVEEAKAYLDGRKLDLSNKEKELEERLKSEMKPIPNAKSKPKTSSSQSKLLAGAVKRTKSDSISKDSPKVAKTELSLGALAGLGSYESSSEDENE